MSQTPDTPTWLAWLGSIGAAAGWVLAVERRILGRPTRAEIKEDLNEIKKHLQRQDDVAEKHREKVSTTLSSLNTKVTVLQTRAGHPPTGDTGTYSS